MQISRASGDVKFAWVFIEKLSKNECNVLTKNVNIARAPGQARSLTLGQALNNQNTCACFVSHQFCAVHLSSAFAMKRVLSSHM